MASHRSPPRALRTTSMSLESQARKAAFIGDVTALAFAPDNVHLFAGSGASISIYHVASHRRVHTCADALDGQKIHGLRCFASADAAPFLVAFGGRALHVLPLVDGGTRLVQLDQRLATSHWIWDVRVLRACSENHDAQASRSNSAPHRLRAENHLQLAIGLSNNKVALFDMALDAASISFRLVDTFACAEQTSLYSMRLWVGRANETASDTADSSILESADEACGHFGCRHTVCVAAGTVFNQILIWTPFLNIDTPASQCAVQCSIRGHQGPAFDLCWNRTGDRLCSVSDDRSVRWWRFSTTARPLLYAAPENLTVTPISTGFGHTCRVWRCALLEPPVDSVGIDSLLATCGEDGALRLWHADSGSLLFTHENLQKSCWSLAYCPATGWLATGGTDSTINFFSASALVNLQSSHFVRTQLPIELDTVVVSLPSHVKLRLANMQQSSLDLPPPLSEQSSPLYRDSVRGVCVESAESIIIITQRGYVYRARAATASAASDQVESPSSEFEWSVVHFNSSAVFSSFCISAPPSKLLALGDQHGIVTLVSLNLEAQPCHFAAHSVNIMSLFWIEQHATRFLCSADAIGNVHVWCMLPCNAAPCHRAAFSVYAGLHISAACLIGPSTMDGVDVSSAATHDAMNAPGFLIIGDQRGNVHIFTLPMYENPCTNSPLHSDDYSEMRTQSLSVSNVARLPALQVFENLHQKERITDLRWSRSDQSLLCVGRDAHLNVLRLITTFAAGASLGDSSHWISTSQLQALEHEVKPDARKSRRARKVAGVDQETNAAAAAAKHDCISAPAQFVSALPGKCLRVVWKHVDSVRLSHVPTPERIFLLPPRLTVGDDDDDDESDAETPSRCEIAIAGFYGANLVLWNASRDEEILRLDVGGGRRPFDMAIFSDSSIDTSTFAFGLGYGDHIAFVRPVPNDCRAAALSHSLNFSFHKRQINDIVCLRMPGTDRILTITASDDRQAKIMSWADANTPLLIASIRGHIDMIRCLGTSQCLAPPASRGTLSASKLSVLLVTAGGKQQVRCVRVSHSLTHKMASGDLESEFLCSIGAQSHEDECRILSIAVFPLPFACISPALSDPQGVAAAEALPLADCALGLHVIATGDSLGRLRIHLFCETQRKFSLVHECTAHARPILQLRSVVVPCNQGGVVVCIASGATDGRVRVVDVALLLTDYICASDFVARAIEARAGVLPASVHESVTALMARHRVPTSAVATVSASDPVATLFDQQLHRAGVNALALHTVAGGILLATGSDDQSLCACTLLARAPGDEVVSGAAFVASTVCKHTAAHSSAVRCITFVNHTHADHFPMLLTSGYDQRLNLWSLDVDNSDFAPDAAACSTFASRSVASAFTLRTSVLLEVADVAALTAHRLTAPVSSSSTSSSPSTDDRCSIQVFACGAGMQCVDLDVPGDW